MAKQSDPTVVSMEIRIEHSFGQWFHVHARPVIIGRTLAEMQAIDRGESVAPIDLDRIEYPDKYALVKGLRLDGLAVYCQGNNDDATRSVYGWTIRYRNVDIEIQDYRDAEAKIATLKTIVKRMDATTAKVGLPATYGQYVSRIAIAIGAERMTFVSSDNRSDSDIVNGISRIDWIVKQWADRRDKIHVA